MLERTNGGQRQRLLTAHQKIALDKLNAMCYTKYAIKSSAKTSQKKLLTYRTKCAILNTESEVNNTSGQVKRPSKSELTRILLGNLEKWIASGMTPEQAIEKLTVRQYDFLIDQNVDLDNLLLTPEQRKNSQTLRRAPRSCSPNGYNKKYPQSKQDLYNGLCAYIETQGATIQPREKQNFRDLDFTIGDTHYRIVLSNPRD